MKQRGRKSSASFIKPPQAGLPSDHLEPPAYLTERARAEWDALVDRFGSQFFPREMQGLLGSLCAVMIDLRDVNGALREFGDGVPSGNKFEKWRDLVRLRGQLAMQLASFSTKLRVTPKSRDIRGRLTTGYALRAGQPALKPWNDDAVIPEPRKNGGHKGK